MKQATQVYSPAFDDAFFSLPPKIRAQIEAKIQELGSQLENYPHHRLQGRREYRIRIADYRVFCTFDLARNILNLHEVGNRREVYR
ncbi:MAG: type II toxin-antitoxin system RelE/ParE family toxin [Opitutus sp.]|nr:type II toxin-antitoxin system RelE/ParE family toxin [Opitutus sp.]